mmetsp:Transcript_20264/g.37825  ORF Transcript_20264/g.37825 Transcript_20264/m.37825 type:complete len:146 (-) Transcript_20264:45-482(-)
MVRSSKKQSLIPPVLIDAAIACLLVYLVHSYAAWGGEGPAMIVFIMALFYFLFTYGFRDKWSSEQTPSAYSVFNKNHREIAGTLSARKIDAQLRHVNEVQQQSSSNIEGVKIQEPPSPIDEDERLKRRAAQAEAAASRIEKLKQT